MKKNVALIGVGPHAKRIYLNYIKKHNINLKLVVELESNKEKTSNYLNSIGLSNVHIYTIDDKNKDKFKLSRKAYKDLSVICENMNINYIILSTEPKAHLMYISFALKNNINILTDKPLTVNAHMYRKLGGVTKIKKDYAKILKLQKHSTAECKIMCQRQYHRGYNYIKDMLTKVVNTYKIPITYIDIYHCDGAWEMPHDLLKENHPYKYGYGKLFHSGYHFIDLLSDFIKINNDLTGDKEIKKCEVYSNKFTPNDEINVFNIDDYKRIFKGSYIPEYYYENPNPKFNKFGEKNFYSLLKFKNHNNQTITNVNLNLLHYGFSRRGWIQTRDFYKENGRIRHERINIHVGPLLNIQVHSYQSKEIKDRTNIKNEELTGGLEHFDIDIYRNTDLIGGLPFERIKLGDLYSDREKENMLGYNELSREESLNAFFDNKSNRHNDIKDQDLGIKILSACALSNMNGKVNKFNLTNEVNLKELKKYSSTLHKNMDKELIDTYKLNKSLTYGINMFYIRKIKKYQVFLYLEGDTLVSGLLLKEFKNKELAKLYYEHLKILSNIDNLKLLTNIIKHKNNTK